MKLLVFYRPKQIGLAASDVALLCDVICISVASTRDRKSDVQQLSTLLT